eukprot:COSAG02_NODE_2387_length_8986_cov_12.395184_9_plen_177_part_00
MAGRTAATTARRRRRRGGRADSSPEDDAGRTDRCAGGQREPVTTGIRPYARCHHCKIRLHFFLAWNSRDAMPNGNAWAPGLLGPEAQEDSHSRNYHRCKAQRAARRLRERRLDRAGVTVVPESMGQVTRAQTVHRRRLHFMDRTSRGGRVAVCTDQRFAPLTRGNFRHFRPQGCFP